jgi:hypothetical protein
MDPIQAAAKAFANSQSSGTGPSGGSSGPSLFDRYLQRCPGESGTTERTSQASTFRQQEGDLIRLGTISRDNPTVSHLLVQDPRFGKDCWDIVHSQANGSKAYRSIQPGTSVYIDAHTREIVWSRDGGGTPGHTGSATGTQQPVASMSEQLAGRPPEHAGQSGISLYERMSEQGGHTTPLRASDASDRASSIGPETQGSARTLIEQSVQRAARRYDLSPALIKAVIKAESNFRTDAVSDAGARGLMQLMPQTAEALGVENAFDVEQNIDGGCKYLRKMLDRFDGNLKQALAAYNAGPSSVIRADGAIPYLETHQYVWKVIDYYTQASANA